MEEPGTEEDECGERRPAGGADLTRDRHTGLAEEAEGRLAPDHREDGVVRESLLTAFRVHDHDLGLANLLHVAAEQHADRARLAVLSEEASSGGVDPLGGRLLDRHLGHRVGAQGLELGDVLRLGTAQLRLAIGERDVRTAGADGDGGLEGRVTATDDKDVLLAEVLGVVQAVVDLVEVLAWDAELAVVPGAADAHDHTMGAQQLCALHLHLEEAALSGDLLGPGRAGHDAGPERPLPQLVE